MTTATAERVRPISAIRADMADALADNSLGRDIMDGAMWAPKKLQELLNRGVHATRLDRAWHWAYAHMRTAIGVIGPKTSVTLLVTSKTGQRSLGWSIRSVFRMAGWSLRTLYRMLTFPLRQVPPFRRVLEAAEGATRNVTRSAPVTIVGAFGLSIYDALAKFFSAENWWIAVINAAALAVAVVRLTRRYAPSGIWRVLAYVVEAPMLATKISPLANRFSATRGVWSKVVDTVEFSRLSEDVVDEATTATRVAAEKAADQADQEVLALEEEKLRLASEGAAADAQLETAIDEANARAARLRDKAEDLAKAEGEVIVLEDIPEPVVKPAEPQQSQPNSQPKPGGQNGGGQGKPQHQQHHQQGKRRSGSGSGPRV